jgi:tagatose 6-phosphate kinase
VVIAVVTPNPAVDVTYRVDEQRIGVTQRVRHVERRPGGKGLNVARVLAALGEASVAVLPLGGGSGAWVAERLDELGLTARVVPIAGETRSTVTVVDDRAHPTMLGEPGPELGPGEWDALTGAVRAAAAGASVLVVSGSLPPGADPAVVGAWVQAAREGGAQSIVDVSGAALVAAAAAGAAVLKPNREELLAATGAAAEASGARQLLDLGAGAVVVSRGSDGLAAYLPSRTLTLPAVAGVTGNPTGAGDAATAGLALALARGLGLSEALRHADAAGAAAVLRPVAGEIDTDAYVRFLAALPAPHEESHD